MVRAILAWNRTILELKLLDETKDTKEVDAWNRTILELKRPFMMVDVLLWHLGIAPFWN